MAASKPIDIDHAGGVQAPHGSRVVTPGSNGARPTRNGRRRNGATAAPLPLFDEGSAPAPTVLELGAGAPRVAEIAGARLSRRSISVLNVIAAEPGLSNKTVGERAGIFNQTHAGEVIRRLRRLGLILNTQPQRRPHENAWELTSVGVEVEQAIRGEVGAGTSGSVGGGEAARKPPTAHLNHREILLLEIIGAECDLSNREIAKRIGIESDSQTSQLLGRLEQRRLIANTQSGPTPQANAWQLTSVGEQLIEDRAVASRRGSGPQGSPGRPESSTPAKGPADPRRARIVAAVVRQAFTEGIQAVDIERVVRSARVSWEDFDECFDGRDAVLLAAFDDALEQAVQRTRTACDAEHGWLERVRVGLLALLELFDGQPPLAMLLLVHSAEAGPVLRARRSEVLTQLAGLLEGERSGVRAYSLPLTGQAVVSGVLGVLNEHLCRPGSGKLVELSNQLMSFIVMPFLGAAAARKELLRPIGVTRAVTAHKAAQELLHNFSGRGMRYPLAPRVLHAIRAEPGLTNSAVAERTDILNEGHMSRALARLRRLGLIENSGATAHLPGRPNSWQLTGAGEEVEAALRYEVSLAEERRVFHRELWLAKQEQSTNAAVSETATAV